MDTKQEGASADAEPATRQRDPAEARRRLLDAGAAVFSEAGYAGARVDVIAARAGLNKRMLYHYFGDKAGLYRAVLEGRLQKLGQPGLGSAEGSAEGSDAGQDLEAFVARLDATLARLLLWDLLNPVAPGAAKVEDETDTELPGAAALVRALSTLPDGQSAAWLAPVLMAFLLVSRARGGAEGEMRADALTPRVRQVIDALVLPPGTEPVKPRIRLKAAVSG